MNLIQCLKLKHSNIFFRLCLFLAPIFIGSPINSCDIKNITDAHLSFLTKLKLPENSLLSIEKNKISIITSKETRAQINATGSEELKIYHNKSDRLVLKGIINSDLDLNHINFTGKPKLSNITHTFISQNGVFIIVGKLNPNEMPSCYTELFYPSNSSKVYYNKLSTAVRINNENQTLTKNLIISKLLNSNHNFDYADNIIKLNLMAHENDKNLAKKVRESQQTNPVAKYLIIKPQRAGMQTSEMHIPISAYNRTLKFKDENELFYSTIFQSSKHPRLLKSEPHYNFDIGIKNNERYLGIGSKFNITENFDSNIELKYSNSKLDVSKLNLGVRKFASNQMLYSSNLGRLSKLNTGLLFNLYKLSEKKEVLINAATYLALDSTCDICIRNGISVGFEQYSKKLDGYTRVNLLHQNFKTQSETTLAISLRKKFISQNQIVITTQYNLTDNSPNIFAKLTFPLNLSKVKINSIGSISYQSHKKELISNWSQDTNEALLENTPGFLKRNWKNYINF